jgi:hypothetical protein
MTADNSFNRSRSWKAVSIPAGCEKYERLRRILILFVVCLGLCGNATQDKFVYQLWYKNAVTYPNWLNLGSPFNRNDKLEMVITPISPSNCSITLRLINAHDSR